jgi:NAD(P)H-hydrate epimerase
VAARLAEATYLPLPDSGGYLSGEAVSVLRQNLAKATALLVGPGLAHNPATVAFVTGLLASPEPLPPLVLDADALNILSTQAEWWRLVPAGSIITPHPAEMARLMGSDSATVQANRLNVAAQMAEKWQVVLLLKGAYTVVSAPDGRTMVLPFANPALAKGGSGDVLAGVIVALRAQGLPPFEAAVAGAYLHGLAGEFVRENVGAMAATAGDLADLLPLAVRAVSRG